MKFIAAIFIGLVFLMSAGSTKTVHAQGSSNCTVYGNNVHCTDPDTGESSNYYCTGTGNTYHCTATDTTADPNVIAGGYRIGEGIGDAIAAAIERHKAKSGKKKSIKQCLKNPRYSFPRSGLSCADYMRLIGGADYEKFLQALAKVHP